jgi:hypothetical protein
MCAHHENQLRGEPRLEQRRAEHMKLKLLGLATLVVVTALASFAADAGPASATPSPVVGQLYVSGFAVSGGGLAELSSSPTTLPAGATAFGIVVTRSRQPDGED